MSEDTPRLLLIDTSGRGGWVAVAEGESLLKVQRLDEARRQARDLAPAVDGLLSAHGWKPRDLHGVVVGLGPGSYTGLRVGVMSAKALCYATGAALIAVETFAALARQVPAPAARVDVLADAQQEKVYVQSFARGESSTMWEPTTPLTIRRLVDWLGGREATAAATGPGVDTHMPRLPPELPLIEPGLRRPLPESLLALGLERYRKGTIADAWAVEPIYLRPSAAEEQWKGKR